MQCSEIMRTDPPYLFEDDIVQTAAQRMRDFDTGFLPVCDFSRRVSGTVTDHDLVVRLCAEDVPSSRRRVHEVMSRAVVSCRPEEDARHARELMDARHVDNIVITDAQGLLRGVIDRQRLSQHEATPHPVGLLGEGVAWQMRSDES